jgi:ubiquinone/menaquinone biosynthesis C-methylase UbiE
VKLFSHITQGARVLEIGFGQGVNIPYYPSCELIGLDIKEDSNLDEDKRKMLYEKGIKFKGVIKGSAESMADIEDSSFDICVSTYAFCTIPNARQALAEVSRVLRKDGLFICVEHILADEDVPSSPESPIPSPMRGLVPSLRQQQLLLDPLQQVVAHGCHLNRKTDQLLLMIEL